MRVLPGPSVARRSSGAQPRNAKFSAVRSVNGRGLALSVVAEVVLARVEVELVDAVVLRVEDEVMRVLLLRVELLVRVELLLVVAEVLAVLTTFPEETTTIVTGIHEFVVSKAGENN